MEMQPPLQPPNLQTRRFVGKGETMKPVTAMFLFALLAILCVLGFLAPRGIAADDAKDKRSAQEELNKIEEQWAEAFVKKDANFFSKLLADDYVAIDPTGTVAD